MSRFARALVLLALLFPAVALAASTLTGVIDTIFSIVNKVAPILVGCAVVVFFWGIVKFVAHGDDEKAVEEGKQVMIWGMIGLFVIVALWGIVGYIQSSLGLDLPALLGTAPSAPAYPS